MRSVAHFFMDATTPLDVPSPEPHGFWDVSDLLALDESLGTGSGGFETFGIIWADIEWHLDLYARHDPWAWDQDADDARAFEEDWWPLP